MLKILFLASGNGGTLIFVNEAIKSLGLNAKISKVIADRNCNAIDYADRQGISSHVINRENFEQDLIDEILSASPDLIITNIHKILSKRVITLYENKFINLHYSLLPAFGGLIGMKTIDGAQAQNCRFVGATVHKVSELVDAGEILYQAVIPVDWQQTTNIKDSVFKAACLILLQYIKDQMSIDIKDLSSYQDINKNTVIFSPKIKRETIYTNNNFWTKVNEKCI